MSARLARLALALYPLAYRRRYGEEMEALVEDTGACPRAVADLVRGALCAHLRPEPAIADEIGRDDRLRLAVSSVLLCWVLFALAGLALYKTTEGRPFEGPGAPGLLDAIHVGVQILAVAGSLALAVGAAPLVLAALRQADTRPEARRATVAAAGCVATLIVATGALVLIAQTSRHGPSDGVQALILAAWSSVALGCGVGCALVARRGLFAITAPRGTLRFAAACASILAAAMVGIALLTLVYLLVLLVDAPDLAAAPNGPFGVPDVRLSLVIQLAAMVAFALPAALSASRARRASAR